MDKISTEVVESTKTGSCNYRKRNLVNQLSLEARSTKAQLLEKVALQRSINRTAQLKIKELEAKLTERDNEIASLKVMLVNGKECEVCNGEGEIQVDELDHAPFKNCKNCDGSGVVLKNKT